MSDGHQQGQERAFGRREIPGMFEGPILPLILRLAAPIFAGMFFQLLYNVTDTIFISRIDLADPSYVGGTGIVFPLLFLAIAVANGIQIGTSSLVARGIGEKNSEVLDKTAESGLAIGVAASLALAAPCYLFLPQLLALLGARGDYLTHAAEYLVYVIPSGVLMFLAAVFTGILQGEGMMKHVMVAMIVGTVANIVLDPIFIFPFALGLKVRGAALATSLSQLLATAYLVSVFVRRKTLVPVHWRLARVDARTIRKIASVGLPQSTGMILMAASFLIFNRVVISVDPVALTAFALCGRLDQVVLMPIFAVSAALVAMIGQNAGRGNFQRVNRIWHHGLAAALALAGVAATAMVVLAPLIYPFFSDVPEVVRYAVRQTRIVEYSFLAAVISILAQSLFQAIGHPLPGLFLTTLRLLLLAVPAILLYVYAFGLGMLGVWLGLVTANLITAGISYLWSRRTIAGLISGRLRPARA